MFSLFQKKKESPVTEIAVAEIPQPKKQYPKVVEDIHNEFNIAGENLLKEAKDIIASIRIENEGKVDDLKSYGFSSTKEVVHTEKERDKKQKKEKLANALEYYNIHFPMYKFITQDMALKICEKYNLVLGDVGQFTGFVPENNLRQIKKFFETENELNTIYYEHYAGMWRDSILTKEKYLEGQRRKDEYGGTFANFHYGTRKNELQIAAPLKDMKKEGYKLSGRIFTKEIPDPVVLAPVKYGDVGLYCIVTAWGDEASDEIVVNETSN